MAFGMCLVNSGQFQLNGMKIFEFGKLFDFLGVLVLVVRFQWFGLVFEVFECGNLFEMGENSLGEVLVWCVC